MAHNIMATLLKDQRTDTECIDGQMIQYIKEIGNIMNFMDKENILGTMAEDISANGVTI